MTETLATRLTRLLARRRRPDLSPAHGTGCAASLRPWLATVEQAATFPPATGAARPLRALPSAALASSRRPSRPALRCTVDPSDERRTLISGRMSEVCDALDRLVARQAATAGPLPAGQVVSA